MSLRLPRNRVPARRAYAVVWDDGHEVTSGRLESRPDRLELHSRTRSLVVPLLSIATATIARGHGHRLRGLPVLTIRLRSNAVLRVATLEGAGVLQEIAAHIQSSQIRTGLVGV